MDISLAPTEDEEVFFAMTGLVCCVNTKTENIYFDFTEYLIDHPKIIENAENVGIYLPHYESYMTIYDMVRYALVHEPLHYLVARLKPCVDYCPFFDIQDTVDNFFLDDTIIDSLDIKLFKPKEETKWTNKRV